MKVYVVTRESPYEDENTEIIKIFDTEEKASEYVKDNPTGGEQYLEYNDFNCE